MRMSSVLLRSSRRYFSTQLISKTICTNEIELEQLGSKSLSLVERNRPIFLFGYVRHENRWFSVLLAMLEWEKHVLLVDWSKNSWMTIIKSWILHHLCFKSRIRIKWPKKSMLSQIHLNYQLFNINLESITTIFIDWGRQKMHYRLELIK